MSTESVWEQKARRLALLSYSLLGAALGGFAVTAYSVVRMMQSQRAGDGIGCVHWQRIRVLASALSISLLTTPLVLPHLSRSSILFRTTPTI